MFDVITATWNPVIGCLHKCAYCWARDYAEVKLCQTEKYMDGFMPKFFKHELSKRYKNKFVFAVDMGDLFGQWVPKDWIEAVLTSVYRNPTSQYLFLTKNPGRYYEFMDSFPRNVVLGTTIESNRNYPVSDAPSPAERYYAMSNLPWGKKLISIEPIMDFDLDVLVQWMKEIHPTIVYIGYDNYQCYLPEPSMEKILQLIAELEKFTRVRKKWEGKRRRNKK
jgi:protein gp37